ncbi:MAG: hypothetical protein SPF11_02410 [Treponema porcinum]|uniref:Uncharacterized protein n=2 Tax=Treponema porcinum TaxID=261392 RepID=A0A1T4MM31_TREPO|nr:hypothetical protein [Treponema porcinum]MCI5645054.1 hypothetical protein [Treponema porcinum]MCI6180617.1 hypothetical protein [Treponema porcinum]MCI6481323.1 hypothetical protein [Treponema porcinum]MCI6816476.1 hypothetical protein [Treponema porcinum]MCI6983990.1 hypothetical protein [Treponema porcinum]
MLGFFFKKNFYDGWDNVLFIFVPNLILDVFFLIGGGLFYLGTKVNGTAGIIIWGCTVLLVITAGSILSLAWAESAAKIADYESAEIKPFFTSLKTCIKDGILYGIVLFAVLLVSAAGIIFYFRPVSGATLPFIGLMAGSVFFWIMLTIISALFWYPSLRAIMHNPFKKSIKKCFIILFDNIGSCVVLGIYNFFLLIISIVMVGLAPGLGGIGLSRVNFLRILLKKYDYLEIAEKEAAGKKPVFRNKIPWQELLKEDIEITGSRSIKSFFMPWKE